jgi:RHS repeat-associated protein
MQSALSQAFSEPLLAAMPQLSEKPHLGVPSSNPAPYLGHEVSKSTTALGLRAALHLERVKSRYTGKERDTESGNDYFGARYYSSAMGRFMSPDWSKGPQAVPYADLENPQSLNLYAYVGNNPLTQVDADGHCWPWGWVCSVGQAIGNAFTGHCFFCTDTQLTNRTEARRQWLEQHTMVIHPDGSTVDWQTADRKTVDHWYGQSHDPSLSVPNLPIPPGLKGFSDFGKKMGWGSGDAEARARMETLTKEELEKNGVTKEMAEKWRDFYKDEIARNPNNPSAAGRADLMQHAADLLDGKQ